VQALRGVDLELRAGEVLAVLGENGAGKSTLIKILGGAHRPDTGTIHVGGQLAHIQSPVDAQRAGISIIYQEFNLIPALSARENIFLGRERLRFGLLRKEEESQQARALFTWLGVEIDPNVPCRDLSVAQQQIVEIAKALSLDAGCVDAWAYLFQTHRDRADEEKAVAVVEARAKDQKNAAPWVALQGFYSQKDETRDKAITFAEKGVEANDTDPIALLCLSALYGQAGKLEKVVELLGKHESKMTVNVHLANNYFEALFQTRQIDKVTRLLNALAGSSNKEVKQFAIQRSQLVAQFLQQQQQRLAAAAKA